MTSSQRIVLNTVATYGRSVFTGTLAIFSSRWVLNALGQTDYGLFGVVGSIIVFITFLNSAMAGSAARHFSFSIGRGDTDEVNKWFNASLCIHIMLAITLISIGWPIGEYCIHFVLTVPTGRIPACIVVFRLSLIAAFSGMVSIPYIAMHWAKQHIAEVAVWGLLVSLVSFVFAYMLTKVSGDHLIFYAGYVVLLGVLSQAILVLRAHQNFEECRMNISYWLDVMRFRELLSFAIWSLIGGLGSLLRDQGTVILLNLHIGPSANAAFGIANQVSAQTSQLGIAMIGALTPEINSSEGRGDRVRVLSLANQASKFGTILVFVFVIPLTVEIDYILKVWLVDSPPHTARFCQLILIAFLMDRLTIGQMAAVNARGRIAAYQATLGFCLLLTLPLAWAFLKLGLPAPSVSIASIITMGAVSAGRVYWAWRLLNASVLSWLREAVIPSGAVLLIAASASIIPRILLSPSILRVAIVTGVSILGTLLASWCLAFNLSEQAYIRQLIRVARIKIQSYFELQKSNI